MNLSEVEILQMYGKQCRHCILNTLLPYEDAWTCFSCCYSVIKKKHELHKIQRKRRNFINRINYAELKMFSICVDAYK